MVKILARKTNGQRVVVDSYFANFKTNTPLGALYADVPVRSPDPKLVYKAHRKVYLESATFTHLLKTAADFPSPVLSNNAQTITVAADVSIDGVPVEAGDIFEMSKSIATTLKTSPGTWQFSDKRSANLLNPPVYTMTSSWAMGWGWRYRLDPDTGELVGLTNHVPSGQSITQGTVKILNMVSLIDGNMNTWADASNLNNGQYATLSFNEVDVRRIVLRATSDKLPGDKSFPSATMSLRNHNTTIGHWFKNIRTGVAAAQGQFTWARGSIEDWATDTSLRTMSGFTIYDGGGSRGRYTIELCIDGPCQLNINGEVPSNGSTVIIPEWLSDDFFPAIAPGSYVVVENSGGSTAWRLKKI